MSSSSLTSETHYQYKDRRVARGRIGPIAPGYPNIYVEVDYIVDSKTGRVNPAKKDTDVKVYAAPYGVGLSEAFNAPKHGVSKGVQGAIVTFSFMYRVEIGNAKIDVDIKGILKIEKEIKPYSAMVEIYGDLNTVTGDGSFNARRY